MSELLDPLTPRPVGLPLLKARTGMMSDARAAQIKRHRQRADRERKARKTKRRERARGRHRNR